MGSGVGTGTVTGGVTGVGSGTGSITGTGAGSAPGTGTGSAAATADTIAAIATSVPTYIRHIGPPSVVLGAYVVHRDEKFEQPQSGPPNLPLGTTRR